MSLSSTEIMALSTIEKLQSELSEVRAREAMLVGSLKDEIAGMRLKYEAMARQEASVVWGMLNAEKEALVATQAREAMLVEALRAITDHVFYECDNEWLELCDNALSNSTEHTAKFMAEVKAKTLEDASEYVRQKLQLYAGEDIADHLFQMANELRSK